ncbi:variable surface lipoprotein [Mycoplasmopsis agalactiae]|uniref:variable surface lipoprotein n=1 Tax=Mycoplasmopsis agalactiae TaxID=2110 RepID=UPI001455EE72|nr:variable surface lipoprotein [Mycoplasmopsis agalactiae]MCE6057015.1 variable surface lipoprotein [Mycoplasmopsis agalactiae]MCE6078803.1 variable surface lipoprotein [Mycoplasmopsis agalactiae]MCE6095186.1 variable surface lipoprotein [Mycoplasmopsis agalactiae]NLS34276.1 variable surface lipoprotein [Mycoplasmopsis agalactiae]
MKKNKLLCSFGMLAPALAFPMIAASCDNESKLKELESKYNNNRKSVTDFLNSEEKFNFLKSYLDIKSTLNSKVDIKSKKEVDAWIKSTADAITSYKSFKNKITEVKKDETKKTFSAFDNLITLSSKVSEKGKGFFPKTIIKQLKSKNSFAKQHKLLNSFLENGSTEIKDESIKNISIDFENSAPNDKLNSIKDGLTLTFVKNENNNLSYTPITWSEIGINNIEKSESEHSDHTDLSKVTENDKSHYLDDSFIIGKIFKKDAFSAENTAEKVFEKIDAVVAQSSNKIGSEDFKKKIEELNKFFIFEANLENDPTVSYSLIGSHAHSTDEYHFYITKYISNTKDSKISVIVHNKKANS